MFKNDTTIRKYTRVAMGVNEPSLEGVLELWERLPHPDDSPGNYHGKWVDYTEVHNAGVELRRAERALLLKQQREERAKKALQRAEALLQEVEDATK